MPATARDFWFHNPVHMIMTTSLSEGEVDPCLSKKVRSVEVQLERIVNSPQSTLPFDNFGITASTETLARNKKSPKKRTARQNASLQDLVAETNFSLPLKFLSLEELLIDSQDKHAGKPARLTVDDLPDRFDNITEELVAKISAGLFYHQLRLLIEPKTSAAVRQEAVEWLLAESYWHEGVQAKKDMSKIPFTAQFACVVEEIDYHQLKHKIVQALEFNRADAADSDDEITLVQDITNPDHDFGRESQNTYNGVPYGRKSFERSLRS